MTGVLAALVSSKMGETINLEDATILGGAAEHGYWLQSDGDVSKTIDGIETVLGQWITPKSHMSDYEVRATLNSGTLTGGTAGSWLNLGTSWIWTSVVGANLTVQIRDAATSTVRDTATIILEAV